MNSRERLTAALSHKEPDRVPVDLGGLATTIELEAYKSLVRHLKIDVPPTCFRQFHVAPDESVLQLFGVDTRYVRPGPADKRYETGSADRVIDDWGVEWYNPPSSYYYDISSSPLQDASMQGLRSYKWPEPDDPGRFRGLADRARDLYENTQYALVADPVGSGVFEQAWILRGLENFLVDLMLNPSFASALMEQIADVHIALWDNYLDAVGEYIQVAVVIDDLGTEESLMMSPDTYRRLVKPVQSRVWSHIKSRTDAALFLHSCGAIAPLIPDLIEIGVDIINPVQVSAKGMDPAQLKQRFGDEIVFWGGGCDTQQVLPYGSADDVRNEVATRIAQLSPGGGFVFCQVHNIQPDVPPENIVAMYQAVADYGRYGED